MLTQHIMSRGVDVCVRKYLSNTNVYVVHTFVLSMAMSAISIIGSVDKLGKHYMHTRIYLMFLFNHQF